MSDRELLELAAKAGGIDYKPDNKDWKHDDHCAFWSYDDLCTCGARWNPRDDDGDALRLAVKLRLEPRFIDNSHSNGIEPSRVTLHNISGIVETVGDDSYAATRRAITRAAAEIGRNMT